MLGYPFNNFRQVKDITIGQYVLLTVGDIYYPAQVIVIKEN